MATYPEECCGILIGRPLPEEEGAQVERLLSAQNVREEESRHNRFLIEPRTILAAQREAEAAGLEIVGYYHSHPDHPPEPSTFDREHAWPGISYVILSVLNGAVEVTRSWRLQDDREDFQEETIDTAIGTPALAFGAR